MIKLKGKIMYQNAIKKKKKNGTKQRKSGTARNFDQKIRTVPLKAGQLEGMTTLRSNVQTARDRSHNIAVKSRACTTKKPFQCNQTFPSAGIRGSERGCTKTRNGEMRNEKLETRKWKPKWKWSSLQRS